MIKNSLLHAYKKYEYIAKILDETKASDRLQKRIDFYRSEKMYEQYEQARMSAQQLGLIYCELENIFKNEYTGNNLTWHNIYRNADNILYGDNSEDNRVQNKKLLEAIITALNSAYPDDPWQFGQIPLYRWRILNAPGRDFDEEDLEEWWNNPNVHLVHEYYYEDYAEMIYCIYKTSAKEKLENSKDDIKSLQSICNELKQEAAVYIVDDFALIDGECHGGYDLALSSHLRFSENKTTGRFGIPLTEQEQVINNAMVKEIDKKCSTLPEMKIIHQILNAILIKVKKLLEANNIQIEEAGEYTTLN